jgi:uncharacterized protein (TIGR02453 family)
VKEFKGFSASSFGFMQRLKENNNRPWLEEHREEWEFLREELKSLCVKLAPFLWALDPALETEPKSGRCLGRINRDTRFATDKRPYREYIDLLFFPRSYGRTKAPGLAVGITAGHCYIGTWLGASMNEWRERFRANLAAWPDLFQEYAESENNFRGIGIDSESLKRPRVQGLPPLTDEWIRRKYYYMGFMPAAEEVLNQGPEIIDTIQHVFLRLYPLFLFATSERPVAAIEQFRRKFAATPGRDASQTLL